MYDRTTAFVAPAGAPRWKRWLVFSPLARIVIFVALFVLLGMAMGLPVHALGWSSKTASNIDTSIAQFVLRAIPALLAYLLLVRVLEHRAMSELAPRKLLPDGLAGVLAGLLLFSSVVGVLWLLGSYHVIGTNPNAAWFSALLMVGLGAGIGEEIMFRGVLFRIVEEGLGTWWALAISALFFGAVHLGNNGATLWSSCAIAIEAGLLFGLIYHVTRSLPLCMGVHTAWNFAQGTIYGIPVSGFKADGWLVSTRSGPDWLSGGMFGAEASVVALGLCSLCTLALVFVALKRRSIIQPSWRRPKTLA